MKHKSNGKYRLILAKERNKDIAAVRKQQLRRGRHISRRKQQRYDVLDANGQGHYKYTGEFKPDTTMVLGYAGYRKATPIDFAINREIGAWNGYVYGMKWAFAKFFIMWYILVIGLY